MLSIGEFSGICRVSSKTLRYYDEIGLLKPSETDPSSGYRYYSVDQLETMLFIERLKSYSFSLEEIGSILHSDKAQDDSLCAAFLQKKKEIERRITECSRILSRIEDDISAIEQGRPVMSYMDDIGISLVEVPEMCIMSVRKKVHEEDFSDEYSRCYGSIFKRIAADRLTITGSPMVLFHSAEYSPAGLDTEFAVPVKEYVTGTRDFRPGLCLKTTVRGDYSQLPSIYAKQTGWAEKEGYQSTKALFEVYVTDPSQVTDNEDNITEVYLPVKKKKNKN